MSTLDPVPPADDRRRWTAVAALAFAAGGFLAALVGTTVLYVTGGLDLLLPTESLGAVGATVLWFAAPTVGAVVTGVPAWWVLVDGVGQPAVDPDGDRSGWPSVARNALEALGERPKLTYTGLGGLSGATSGALAHVVMWVIIVPTTALVDGDVATMAEFLEVVRGGIVLGLVSILATGIITVPILGAVGLALGYARYRGTTPGSGGDPGSGPDDDPGPAPDDEWDRMNGSPGRS